MDKYYYLIHIQYLGFRYHGWLKQPELKTVESMIEKTIEFILGHTDFKILGASRTDSKVSANHSAFELFVNKPLDINQLLMDFNHNLPNDIKVLEIEEKDKNFNIICDLPNSGRTFCRISHRTICPLFCCFAKLNRSTGEDFRMIVQVSQY